MTTMRTNSKQERRTFSIIMQVVTFVTLVKAESDTAKMVESCVFSKMTLNCNEEKMINISSVVLGDSVGCLDANCCPKNDSCTVKPNDNHINEVHRRCNGRLTCTVDVIQERIPCESTFFINHNNDFERITYVCIDKRKMVEGCAFSKMTLTCNERKVINVLSVVLGDSPGCSGANCCPKNDSCTAKPKDNHVNEVHRRCNGRQRCTVDVIRERIPCESTYFINHYSDFERITYICINNRTTDYIPEIHTTMEDDTMTGNERYTTSNDEAIESYTTDSKTQMGANCASETMLQIPITMGCLMAGLVIIIVILIIIICKRKKRQIKTNSSGVKLSVAPNFNNEATYSEIEIDNRTYDKLVKPGPEDCSRTYDSLVTGAEESIYH